MKKILIALLTIGFLGGCTSASYTNVDHDNAMDTNQNTLFPDSPVTDQMTLIQTFF
ncbi:hypothetical protein KP803_14185 [Vibrio sp. ZSDE26]|uniref:Lipoprotein n=1 Tax=Vibrio amylolyticus TaxID=2847292 RepID=A0A9X2BHY7_9VIBR|nr:hypothetical protein [Vibrio amylolyticus]MCK6264426.1 hypothetical protein [Vibrio amylolyticus]